MSEDNVIHLELPDEVPEYARMTPQRAQSFAAIPEVQILLAITEENWGALAAMKQAETKQEWVALMRTLPAWERKIVNQYTKNVSNKA